MPFLSDSIFENLIFHLYFLNKGISVNIRYKSLKFEIQVHEGYLEGSVSQNFYLCPSFCVMKSRK